MDRVIVYPGAIPLETDILNAQKNSMIGQAKTSGALFGTTTTVNGLACTPTSPASMQVSVAAGEIYSLQNVDGTAYSSLSADTTHSILKQGIMLDAVSLSCPAPTTSGYSTNFLIQAIYQDTDANPVVLPYYNASNPTQAYSGPNNAGTTQNTTRKGVCTVAVKAGISATTGSQTTPAPDSGYVGLWVVTVANGQTSITSTSISQAVNAPIMPAGGLVNALQNSSLIVGVDTGAANACVVSYSPAIAALKDGMVLWFKAAAANTGATTLNVNGLGAQPVVGGAQSALQGGEIVANGKCCVVWSASSTSFVLIECTGGTLQVAPASQSNHAMQFGQSVGRLLNIRIFASSGTYTYTPTVGTNSIIADGAGAGGAGGGAAAAGSGNQSTGGGGSAGAWGRKRITSGFAGATITIGAGGVGNAGATGGTGGTTSFGSLLTLPGGVGGSVGAISSVASIGGGISSSATPSGFDVGGFGQLGSPGIALSATSALGGAGGNSAYGMGASPTGANTTSATQGNIARGNAAGGGGAVGINNSVAPAGGNGVDGIMVIYEYS